MNRIDQLNRRYAAVASLDAYGVEVVLVDDPVGTRLDLAVRRLVRERRDDASELWDDLVGAAKALRWRVLTQPQPLHVNPHLRAGAAEVKRQIERLRGAVANDLLLDDLLSSTIEAEESDSPVGGVLLRSISEVGPAGCVVISASRYAQVGLQAWLGEYGVRVFVAADLNRHALDVTQEYAVGPPRIFRSSVVTAPSADEVSFLMPAWYGDRTVPASSIATFAEWAIHVKARITSEGDIAKTSSEVLELPNEDDLLPQPLWGSPAYHDRESTSREVAARKVLLAGGLAMWLDDGERIRTLDPSQPAGERVSYADVYTVQAGTYLLLRRGETESGALYDAGLKLLAGEGADVDETQRQWKESLSLRVSQDGYREVVRKLEAAGLTTAKQAKAWTAPHLIRPHSDKDFELLLEWLRIPTQPTFRNATRLRKMIYQASADIREELEAAVSEADMSMLELSGYLCLDFETGGFRSIVATRVQAVSPRSCVVPRHEVRVLFEDRGGLWLE